MLLVCSLRSNSLSFAMSSTAIQLKTKRETNSSVLRYESPQQLHDTQLASMKRLLPIVQFRTISTTAAQNQEETSHFVARHKETREAGRECVCVGIR